MGKIWQCRSSYKHAIICNRLTQVQPFLPGHPFIPLLSLPGENYSWKKRIPSMIAVACLKIIRIPPTIAVACLHRCLLADRPGKESTASLHPHCQKGEKQFHINSRYWIQLHGGNLFDEADSKPDPVEHLVGSLADRGGSSAGGLRWLSRRIGCLPLCGSRTWLPFLVFIKITQNIPILHSPA